MEGAYEEGPAFTAGHEGKNRVREAMRSSAAFIAVFIRRWSMHRQESGKAQIRRSVGHSDSANGSRFEAMDLTKAMVLMSGQTWWPLFLGQQEWWWTRSTPLRALEPSIPCLSRLSGMSIMAAIFGTAWNQSVVSLSQKQRRLAGGARSTVPRRWVREKDYGETKRRRIAVQFELTWPSPEKTPSYFHAVCHPGGQHMFSKALSSGMFSVRKEHPGWC